MEFLIDNNIKNNLFKWIILNIVYKHIFFLAVRQTSADAAREKGYTIKP
jgi:hypothetical protein